MTSLMIMTPSNPGSFGHKGQRVSPCSESLLCCQSPSRPLARLGHAQHNGSSVIFKPYLEIGSIILGDVGTVTLAQHCDLLLNVLYLVLGFFQINDFYGNHFLSPIVNAFEHLAKRALSNFFQLGKKLFRVCFQVLRGKRKGGISFPGARGGSSYLTHVLTRTLEELSTFCDKDQAASYQV